MPLKELALIQRIRRAAMVPQVRARRLGANLGGDAAGIGDDCAVLDLPRGTQALVTTDFTLEGVHFRREWHPADSVGHRCLARGLSDIAAMGGTPHAAFLSLALPGNLPQRWVDDFIAGLMKLAKQYSVTLAGGDTAQSPHGILADIAVLGSVPKGKAILRSGARPGDFLYVTGTLGLSLATLQKLRHGEKLRPAAHPRHFYPIPRLVVGQYLREKKLATAMVDTSDGLSTDLRHLCDESRVGAVVDEIVLPVTSGRDRFRNALHGGEDYELLFTARPDRDVPDKIAGVPVTRIGGITKTPHLKLWMPDGSTRPLKPQGWQHFA
jgi:thiamine-monophosphate kinase